MTLEEWWFEPVSAADVAAAVNLRLPPEQHISARAVSRLWAKAQRDGRLPPFERPTNGFRPGPLAIIKEFVAIYGRAA